jgi:hypothetical protein
VKRKPSKEQQSKELEQSDKAPSDDNKVKESVDALMTEIESDIRDEQIQKLWLKHKSLVLVIVISLIAVVSGYQVQQNIFDKRLAEQAEFYSDAKDYLVNGEIDTANDIFAKISEQGGAYGAIADFKRAGILLQEDKLSEAVTLFRSLSEDVGLQLAYRDLATMLWGIHGLDTENITSLESSLAVLTDPSNGYSYMASELMALLAARRGALGEARSILNELISDTGTPTSIRRRSQELLTVFGEAKFGGLSDPSSSELLEP